MTIQFDSTQMAVTVAEACSKMTVDVDILVEDLFTIKHNEHVAGEYWISIHGFGSLGLKPVAFMSMVNSVRNWLEADVDALISSLVEV